MWKVGLNFSMLIFSIDCSIMKTTINEATAITTTTKIMIMIIIMIILFGCWRESCSTAK